ncbi:Growth_factor receptor cysteine-rich domain superfamily [Hexamita inflata]|uniref:Growth factor receptor cysteine-rich domain superfamily n=1 Tax=Hexamita inflata TaxID=28002 RepID=A0AA86NMH8_9EUKA|nr:Growth factor receptor cysteine-rich domain superfamily [Hexamita inflata]CAI9923002.1 Growth factor receptor cysteine-rich domain superfamily [Hexamita inflata]
MQSVGIAEQVLNINGTSTLTCQQLCADEYIVTFGICHEIIQFATTLDNFTQICNEPFIFDSFNNICLCQYGYYLNGTICVNVINEFSEIVQNMSSIYLKLQTEIQQTDIVLKSIFYDLEKEILTNISNLSKLVSETHLDLKLDINTINQTLYNTLMDIQTDIDFNFKFNSDQNVITQAIIKQFYIETSNNFSVVNTKLGSVSTLMIDNNLNITNQYIQTQIQISDLQNEISNNFSQVEQSIDGLITKITSLSAKIDQLNLAATGCKTIGATEEGDGLCTCTTKFGNIQSSHKNGFDSTTNKCCTQYMYLSEALICSDGQQYYHYAVLRQYTNVPW